MVKKKKKTFEINFLRLPPKYGYATLDNNLSATVLTLQRYAAYTLLNIYCCDRESSTILMHAEHIFNVKQSLRDNGFTLADFVLQILADPGSEDRESLIQHATSICAALYSIDGAHVLIFGWCLRKR